MPDPVTGAVVVGGALLGNYMQGQAASDAADTQAQGAQMGIDEQHRQFDAMRALLQPYTQAGVPALEGMQALLGLLGPEAEAKAISGIRSGEGFQAKLKQGEESILSRASVTGGLRGGNVQAALSQFSPQLLQAEIENRYGKLAGLTQLGQQSAAGVGSAGIQTGTNISNLLGNQAAAQAQGQLAQGQMWGQLGNLPMSILGLQAGAGGMLGLGFGGMF